MGDELERLRDVVRALLAERRSRDQNFARVQARMAGREQSAEPVTEEDMEELARWSKAHRDRKVDLEWALVRLREVAPALFSPEDEFRFAEPGAAADRAGTRRLQG
jgi:hypothetical protein